MAFFRFICILLACLSPFAVSGESAPPQIRRVRVEVRDVFHDTENFFKQVVNILHTNTRESVILSQLLYRAGDPYDPELVAESERLLRRYDSFLVLTTTVHPVPGADAVDLVVVVQDVWTLNINFNADLGGGVSKYTIYGIERNLLGRHLYLGLGWNRDAFQSMWNANFHEPMLFGTRLRFTIEGQLHYELGGGRVGEGYGVILEQPLYARSSEWGFKLQALQLRTLVVENEGDKARTFEPVPGVLLDRKYGDERAYFLAEVSRSSGTVWKHTGTLGFSIDHRAYAPHEEFDPAYLAAFREQILPDDYRRHMLRFGYTLDNFTYVKTENFFHYGRPEDIALGWEFKAFLGVTAPAWGSVEKALHPSAGITWTGLAADRHYLSVHAGISFRYEAGASRNALGIFRYSHYVRRLPLGFLAARIEFQIGDDLDRGKELSLGGFNGLRGYRDNRFEGDRRLLLNTEYRFNPLVLDFLRLAPVVFFDLGGAWYARDATADGITLYPALGLGLRLTMPTLNPNVIRFDVGWNFGNDSKKFTDLFSFGYNHAF